jgi:hypothetical protein
MPTVSEDPRPKADGTTQEQRVRRPSQGEREKRIGSFRHLFGPAYVAAVASLVVIVALLVVLGTPTPYDKAWPPRYAFPYSPSELKDLFDHTLKDYTAGLAKLETNLSAQALVVATAVLVIIRRSDSLNLFGNSIPLSWLHVFIPILLVFLFMGYGYISHRLIASRMHGVEIACALSTQTAAVSEPSGDAWKCGSSSPHQELFRDASWIDGWYISFIDTDKVNISGIERKYSRFLKILLIVVLGTQTAAAHASTLALLSIGCRRYLATRQERRLAWYYLLPLVPLVFLGVSHFLFAYGGPHKNIYQLYVATVSVLLMAFLLWLSAKIDKTSFPETLYCLRWLRQVTLSGTIQGSSLSHSPGSGGDSDRTIVLIGDSLSTTFHASSLPQMLVRARRGWKTNWFLTLPLNQRGQSVLTRLSALGAIRGIHHASVGAMVDVDRRRSVLNHLMNTYHFCHQVDETLSGPFPDILLIWIGHNDIDWKWRADSLTSKSLLELSDSFIHAYEVQLRRLLDGALASGNRSVIIVFGWWILHPSFVLEVRQNLSERKIVRRFRTWRLGTSRSFL